MLVAAVLVVVWVAAVMCWAWLADRRQAARDTQQRRRLIAELRRHETVFYLNHDQRENQP